MVEPLTDAGLRWLGLPGRLTVEEKTSVRDEASVSMVLGMSSPEASKVGAFGHPSAP